MCKLSLVLSGLFLDVINRGFCDPSQDDTEAAGDGDKGDLDGIGM